MCVCVCVSEGAEQNWKQHCNGSCTAPLHSLRELSSFFSVFPALWGITVKYVGVGAPFQRNLTRCRYSTPFRSLIHSVALVIHYVRDREWALRKWMPAEPRSNRGDAQQNTFPLQKVECMYTYLILHFNSELSTTRPICKYFFPPALFSHTCPSIINFNHIQSLLPYLSSHLLVCE